MNNLSKNEMTQDQPSKVLKLPLTNQNFGLTQSQFEEIVIQLKNGNEDLFERIFISQFEDAMNYLIKNYKAAYDIAYDTTMDTMLDFRLKLINDKVTYGNLRYLFTKIATQHYLKSNIKDERLKQMLLSESTDIETDGYEERLSHLNAAWKELDASDRQLLENYYYKEIPLNKIAQMEDKTDQALRKQKQRAIEKLRQFFFNKYTL